MKIAISRQSFSQWSVHRTVPDKGQSQSCIRFPKNFCSSKLRRQENDDGRKSRRNIFTPVRLREWINHRQRSSAALLYGPCKNNRKMGNSTPPLNRTP